MWWPSLVLGRHLVTILSLRTIPRAPKLSKKIYTKKVLNWAKKGANFKGVSRMIQGSYKSVVRRFRAIFQRYFKGISRKYQRFLKEVLIVHVSLCVHWIYRPFWAWYRVRGCQPSANVLCVCNISRMLNISFNYVLRILQGYPMK